MLFAVLVAALASMDLFARATDPNPTLNAYTASAQLSATMHAAIPFSKTFSGAVYYQRPNRRIEFAGVPGPLSRFRALAATTPTYEQAMQQYTITPLRDDEKASTYRLVPRERGGSVKDVVVTISNRTALLTDARWHYTNGGTLTFRQTYATVGIFRLPAKATISARFPGYSADGTLTFSTYKLNAR